jgi:hypothetical protein
MKDFNNTVIRMACVAIFAYSQISTAQIPAKDGEYWYRGNTHTHARLSDENNKNDVPEIASWYEKAGYNFLLLSEHNNRISEKKIFCHDEAAIPPAFIMLCGLEMSKSRHHTALGIDKYIGDEKSLQDGVNKVIAAGGVAILNHPQDPVMTAAKFIATKGLNHMEIVNGGRLKDTPASEILWDSILSAPDGRRVFAVASDDNHYKEANVGKGWIMVKAINLTPDAIEESIRQGFYYATTGVLLDDFSVEDKYVTVASQNGDTIRFIGRNGTILKTITGSGGKYKIKGNELYVRLKITNSEGKAAWTQPHYVK